MDHNTVILTKEICNNPQKMYDTLNELAINLLSPNIHKYFSDSNKRKELINEYGEKAYMIPSKTKFPVINPLTGKFCKPLIEAVKIRAYINNYPKTLTEIDKLCSKIKCDNVSIFKFEDSDEEYNLFEILELLNINFENVEKKDNDSEEYKQLFKILLQKYGVEKITDLDESKKKKFFNELDSKWQSDKEREKSETYTEQFNMTLKSFKVENINELDTDTFKRFINLVENKW